MNWISVKDKLPELIENSAGFSSDYVLVYIITEGHSIAYYTQDGWAYNYGDLMNSSDINNLTHWSPLPEPPKTI